MRRLQRGRFSSWIGLLGGLVVTAMATGCATMQLHSATREKQADVAKEAWTKVDVKGQLTTARELQANILARQQAILATTAGNNRELLIRQMAYGSSMDGSFGKALKAAMLDLTGGDAHLSPGVQTFKTWESALRKEQAWAENYARKKLNFTRFGLELPSCITWDEKGDATKEQFDKWFQSRPANDPIVISVKALLKDAQNACKEEDRTASVEPRASLKGQLKTLITKLDETETQLTLYEERGKEARNRYISAKSAYDIAERKFKTGNALANNVKEAAADLEVAAKAIVDLDGLFNEKFLSEARRDSLGRFVEGLTALKTGEELPADSAKFLLALKVVPEFVDSTRQALVEAKKPLLVPLLLRRDQERLKAETIDRDIAALKLREKLMRQQLLVATKRAKLLADPLEYYDTMLSEAQRSLSLSKLHADIASKANPDDNLLILYRALSRLLYAEGTLLGTQLQLEFQDSAIDFERSVSYAEGAVLQWHALIDTSVAQLDAYAKSGVKTETLTSLVNALGVLWIGHGVNK